jgi:hypothetical protein
LMAAFRAASENDVLLSPPEHGKRTLTHCVFKDRERLLGNSHDGAARKSRDHTTTTLDGGR